MPICDTKVGYYDLRFGGNETMRFYMGSYRLRDKSNLKPKLGYLAFPKSQTTLPSKVKTNHSLVIYAENHHEFNDCLRYVLDDNDYSRIGKSSSQLLSTAIRCKILNTGKIKKCEDSEDSVSCKLLITDFSLDNQLVCTWQWFSDRNAFGLNITVADTVQDISVLYGETFLDSSINVHGLLSCTVVGTRMNQEITISVDFKKNTALKSILPQEITKGSPFSKYIPNKSLTGFSLSAENVIAIVFFVILIIAAVALFLITISRRHTNGLVAR